MGPWWHGASIVKTLHETMIKSLQFLHVGCKKKKGFNDSKWMDMGIAFYELDVIK